MKKLFLRKEHLRKRELLAPLTVLAIQLGFMNGIRVSGEVLPLTKNILCGLSGIISLMMIPPFQSLVMIRFTRLYNTLLWLLPCGLFFLLHDRICLMYQATPEVARSTSLLFLRLPLLFLLYKHLCRIIHLIIFHEEPLIITRGGPAIIDEELRWEEIPSDRTFNILEGIGYYVIGFLWY